MGRGCAKTLTLTLKHRRLGRKLLAFSAVVRRGSRGEEGFVEMCCRFSSRAGFGAEHGREGQDKAG